MNWKKIKTMFGVYTLHCHDIPKEVLASYRDIYIGGVEYHPKRKKLKGYQKSRK